MTTAHLYLAIDVIMRGSATTCLSGVTNSDSMANVGRPGLVGSMREWSAAMANGHSDLARTEGFAFSIGCIGGFFPNRKYF